MMVGMSKICDLKTKIRLDTKSLDELVKIQKICAWPVSLNVLANFGILQSLGAIRRNFNPKQK